MKCKPDRCRSNGRIDEDHSIIELRSFDDENGNVRKTPFRVGTALDRKDRILYNTNREAKALPKQRRQ